ncbi:hypothetical protein [Metabacillus bambusae]|uniref:Uncharacterized protein n=1 Tax=Metabacillus bambusae TaxID=2795218 RepID=A0ABS3NA71_9BACI|nr:hypothetical protein [Metabacillus bambusae]MBO1515045.1 hypothetical protein [Metabacillus bambusae]
MPIVTLLEHLKNTQKRCNIGTNSVTLKNVAVDLYDISENSLLIFTDQNHEIQIDISDFKEIAFDAIVSRPTSSIDMQRCLRKLSDKGKYNAYLRNNKEKYILDFYHIPADY